MWYALCFYYIRSCCLICSEPLIAMKSFCVILAVSCCLAVACAKTQCEEHRERELKSNTKVKLVPRCTSNGDYEALQCFEGSNFCMCWRPDGSHINAPSNAIKTCACHVHLDNAIAKSHKGMVGHLIPKCNEDGTYAKKQCSGSMGLCWCADEKGNRVSEQVRGHIEC
ncbi:hypothetical protein JTE90_011150 [Oedothorax gibbosus]|uniref:Thyroglobulin type-1 domain-containing protein n=1 Tax=Oedothorax gibbosus TaxID=931172 RepID=A0AAV6U0W4_9ARAC|nr:hypothetical protein JTE90_011150 [Oedothorax gibbosus]